MIKFASARIILTLAVILIGIRFPKTDNWRFLRISRIIFISSYAIIGLTSLLTTFVNPVLIDRPLKSITLLIVCSFQVLIFSSILFIFVAPKRISMLRLLFQLTVITIVGTTILVSFFSENQHVFNITFYLGVGLYIVQCTFYTVIQVKAYHTNIVKLEEFYDEDEHQRLKWARMSFYSAITLAFLASFVIINYHYYTFFMVLYTTFFVLFAIKFANFRIDAAYIVKALTISKDFTENITETNIPDQEAHINKEETVELSKLHKSLEKWIQEKKYKINDISIDEIVDELNTDRDTFRLYFRQKNNSDFRQWRTELRILEAQRIIKENPKISISEVSEDVGFNDKGNFHRLFKKFVGVTPSDFKDHCITDAILAKTKLSADVAQVIDSQGD